MITLTRTAIETFLSCKRKFELRYLLKHPWPNRPVPRGQAESMELGSIFHQMVAQHYLAVRGAAAGDQDPRNRMGQPLGTWWRNFTVHGPTLKTADRVWVEKTLRFQLSPTIELLGRIDMVQWSKTAGLSIYDWKTGKPRSRAKLLDDWQTRLYLALVYQTRDHFDGDGFGPEQIRLTYWYAQEPAQSTTIRYDGPFHAQNMAELTQIAAEIEALVVQAPTIWPLTPDELKCRHCPFRALCGRHGIDPTQADPEGAAAGREMEPHDDDNDDEARIAYQSGKFAPDLSLTETEY